MIKEHEEKEVSSHTITSYKQNYIVDTLKNTYGRGMAVILEGEVIMNILVWNKGTYISPQDKAKVSIEWMRDLIGVLENEFQKRE